MIACLALKWGVIFLILLWATGYSGWHIAKGENGDRNDDLYFNGEDGNGKKQQEITADDLPKNGGDQNDDLYFNGEDGNGKKQQEITADDLPKNGELFEGDMVMDNVIRRAVLGEESKKDVDYFAEDGYPQHWPKGRVPYIIDKSFKPALRKQLRKAIATLNLYTCIRYVPKRNDDNDYVRFADGNGCSSSVGRRGGEQKIHLAIRCQRKGTVLHEMMHVIGIVHEQSRPDRDKYVKVLFNNIQPDMRNNFRRYRFYEVDNMDIDYNYNSVMHYSNFAFTRNEMPTLISKLDRYLIFGQRIELTPTDVKQINRLYNCPPTHAKLDLLFKDMTPDILMKRLKPPHKHSLIKSLFKHFFETVFSKN